MNGTLGKEIRMQTETKRVKNFVGGEQVDPSDGRFYDVVNPSTGEAYAQAPASGKEDADRAFDAAEKAFESWRDSTPSERQLALLRLADAIEERGEELVRAESENTGKPIGLTMEEEIPAMADQIRFFAGAARVLEGKSAGEYLEGYTSIIRREPVGVCAQVTPWNYPMMMAVWKFAPAIAAGNTVVLKPSDTTPVTALRLAELAAEVLPPGVLNVVCGQGETAGVALVEHPDVAMVSLTGSVAAGQAVARAAATSLKRVHLELGGKAPVIVFDDADLEAVAAGVRTGGYYNSGQDCTAATRVIAGPRIYDDLVQGLSEEGAAIPTGDPSDPGTEMGPVVSEEQRQRVAGMVDRALAAGAEAVVGGSARAGGGFFYEPSLIVGVGQDDQIVLREGFGP